MSNDILHQNEEFDFQFDEDVEIINLPDWAHQWKEKNGDWWGGIPNKFESFYWLAENKLFKKEDVLLFLDPDMIFIDSVNYHPESDEIIGQLWEDYTPLRDWPQESRAFMYPFVLQYATLEKIKDDFKKYCLKIREHEKKWESDMWALDYAAKKNGLKIKYLAHFGRCTAWNKTGDDSICQIIHYPNIIKSTGEEHLFFKQDYTFQPNQRIEIYKTKNKIDRQLLINVSQQRTDFIYHLKWNFDNILKNYSGEKGYLVVKPWPGGFNNIRMSLELGICLAFLTDRTLVLPVAYNMYLLEGQTAFSDFYDLSNLGISVLDYDELSTKINISSDEIGSKNNSKILNFDIVNNVVNFEKIPIPSQFLKGRKEIQSKDYFNDEEIIFLDENLLGNFYLSIYTSYEKELKKIIAKHVVYKREIFDVAWQFINHLGDQKYFALHVRRNDFQYKDLYISAEEILENIQDQIPKNSKLYIATDHKEKDFFEPLLGYYNVVFYSDLRQRIEVDDFDANWIPIIEQLICTRSIKFVGMKLSTLSSYVYRLRGYMQDIDDKEYYINTEKYSKKDQCDFINEEQFIANWAREYKCGYDLQDETIFVSIASYCDSQLIPTIKNLLARASNPQRVTLGVHIQDNGQNYKKLLSEEFENIKILYTSKKDSKGVVWARNRINRELFQSEHYYLQIDSHSRFKKNWDNILIHQHKSIEEDNVVITTYPNNFNISDVTENYLDLSTNSPLRIKKFLSDDLNDNRLTPENGESLSDFDIVNMKWCSAGFLFASGSWVSDVQLPDDVVFNGEEDLLTHISFLKGYNLRLGSEACVWHNYNFKNEKTGKRYKDFNENEIKDHSIDRVNQVLFGSHYKRSLNELEVYLGHNFRPVTKYFRIYVSISAYLDIDILNTIESCIDKAKYPDNLTFGICWQYDMNTSKESNLIDDLASKYSIQIDRQPYRGSKGVGWARSKAMSFYNNEKFCLQIDSHIRFIQDWDELLINDYNVLLDKSDKPIISYLPPDFNVPRNGGADIGFDYDDQLDMINIPEIVGITDEYWFDYANHVQSTGYKNIEIPVLDSSFVFTDGRWISEVYPDPEMYYLGEEVAISIRSYTSGYDLYSPSQIVSWHRKTSDEAVKHYNTHEIQQVKKLHEMSMVKLKNLVIDRNTDSDHHGLGISRSLESYMKYAGIDFDSRAVKKC
ncbi:MAG: GlcNAc-transferase family protein [Saprospiraceae bacterium]